MYRSKACSPSWFRIALLMLVLLTARVPGQRLLADPPDTTGQKDALAPAKLKAANFQGVTPGKSTRDDVQTKLGQPAQQQDSGNQSTLEYQLGPFAKVQIFLTDETVSSIVAHLKQPLTVGELANDLGLSHFTPVQVKTELGELLGLAYPERGVLFSYAVGSSESLVSQVLLEPLSAETFLLRFEQTSSANYTQRLTDLEHVLDLDANHAEAHWLGARLLAAAGDHAHALELSRKAVRLSPGHGRYLLTQAELLADDGQRDLAIDMVKGVLELRSATPNTHARAEVVLGDLLASGPKPDYRAAIEHHLAAVKAATPLVSQTDRGPRHDAEEILIDAYLGTAHDIALGEWAQKETIVPKWLRNADELAKGFVERDRADRLLPLRVARRTLTTYANMDVEVDDAGDVFAAVQRTTQSLLATSEDPLYRQHIQWELLQATVAAARLEQLRDRNAQALQYANQVISTAEQLASSRSSHPPTRYVIGSLFFQIGSIHAVQHQDHSEAVRWYERALLHFEQKRPASAEHELGRHGERFVSMGVSYWKNQLQDEALSLTRRGLSLMQQATTSGTLDQQALVVPYTNLAEMCRATGRDDEARDFTARIARLQRANDDADQP